MAIEKLFENNQRLFCFRSLLGVWYILGADSRGFVLRGIHLSVDGARKYKVGEGQDGAGRIRGPAT